MNGLIRNNLLEMKNAIINVLNNVITRIRVKLAWIGKILSPELYKRVIGPYSHIACLSPE